MGLHLAIVAVVLALSALFPIAGTAAEKKIADIKELAGEWHGWATSQLGSQSRVTMIIKPNGDYESSTTSSGGTLTRGKFYLENGKLRYKSSRTEGSVTLTEDRGKTSLTQKPDGTVNVDTGPATFEKVK